MDREPPPCPPRPPAAGRRVLLVLVCVGLGACASRPGHYYQDDGPPDHAPAGLAQTPDAVPRVEPLNPRANRPYAALGRSYTPDTSDGPFEQRGIASWYGRQYQGNPTASGEPYDMFAMSAAHPTLPIPSYARVTRVSDGRSVIVRINDRGPFVQDRVIDLSYAAATRLGIVGPGSGEVSVRKITARDIATGNFGAPGGVGAPATAMAAAPATPPLPPPQPPVATAAALPTEAAIQSRVVASADSPAPPDEPAAALVAPAPAAAAPTAGAPALALAAPSATSSSVEAPAAAAPNAPATVPPTAAAPGAAEAQPASDGAMTLPAPLPATAPAGSASASTGASTSTAPPAPPAASTAAQAAASPASSPAASPAATAAPAGKQSPGASGKGKWSVQLGAFAQLSNAEALRDEVSAALARPEAGSLPAEGRQPRIEFDGRLHHVLIGSFDARGAAQRSARTLRQLLSRDTTLYQR